jgi:hypothetical protein
METFEKQMEDMDVVYIADDQSTFPKISSFLVHADFYLEHVPKFFNHFFVSATRRDGTVTPGTAL